MSLFFFFSSILIFDFVFFFFSSRRRHTRFDCDWSSDVCSSDLSAFLDGLGQAYAERGVRVVCARPGFVKTEMTAGLPVPPFAGEPEPVARAVLDAISA